MMSNEMEFPNQNPNFDEMLKPEAEIMQRQNPNWKKPSIISCLVSFILVCITQFSFSLLPLFLPSASFLSLLPLSAVLLVVLMGSARLCKRAAGVKASALAFVFFTIIFVWAIYISVVRRVISSLLDIVMNMEIIMVLIGLSRITSLDPGFVTQPSRTHLSVQNSIDEVESQGEELKVPTSVTHQESPAEEAFTRHGRVRYCSYCKNYVMGYDHHCPGFGNCIGQRNHALFLVLVVGFVMSEASFVICASQFTVKSEISREVGEKAITSRNFVVGTALYCVIQVLWQINWKKYPEFQSKVTPRDGQPQPDVQFINPYDKGILSNLKEFFTAKG